MNAISLMANAFEWTINNAAYGLQIFLDGNYYIVAFFINTCKILSDFVSEALTSINYVLYCYYLDFLAFINELYVSVMFIESSVYNFVSNIFINTYGLFCYITEIICTLYTKTVLTAVVIQNYILFSIENFLYFCNLLFAAVLIILQLGPNLILFLYHALVVGIINIFYYLQISILSIVNYCIMAYLQSKAFIYSIPPKAHFGIILFIVLYYKRRIIQHYIYHCTMPIGTWFMNWFKAIVHLLAAFTYKLIFFISNHLQNLMNYVCRRNDNVAGSTASNKFKSNYLNQLIKAVFCRDRKPVESPMERILCVVCQDKEKTVLLIPCRHLCMCEDCTAAVQESYLGCPLCRKQILETVHVYT